MLSVQAVPLTAIPYARPGRTSYVGHAKRGLPEGAWARLPGGPTCPTSSAEGRSRRGPPRRGRHRSAHGRRDPARPHAPTRMLLTSPRRGGARRRSRRGPGRPLWTFEDGRTDLSRLGAVGAWGAPKSPRAPPCHPPDPCSVSNSARSRRPSGKRRCASSPRQTTLLAPEVVQVPAQPALDGGALAHEILAVIDYGDGSVTIHVPPPSRRHWAAGRGQGDSGARARGVKADTGDRPAAHRALLRAA